MPKVSSVPILPYQAAKWLKIPLLIDTKEMENLFSFLSPFSLWPLSGVRKKEEFFFSCEQFLFNYQLWIDSLQRGEEIELSTIQKIGALAWTVEEEALTFQEVSKERYLLKIVEPVVQMQPHFIGYSEQDKTFHSMVFGRDTLFWGVQISYPQIYQSPTTGEFKKAIDFPNGKLFSKIRKWVREYTAPTPFWIEGERMMSSFRLGKACFSWIANHPGLNKRGLEIR